MSSKKLFLNETYTLDGVTVTGKEIKEALIDQAFLKGRLSELLGGK